MLSFPLIKNGAALAFYALASCWVVPLPRPSPVFALCDSDCGVEAPKSEPAVAASAAEGGRVYAAWKYHAVSS